MIVYNNYSFTNVNLNIELNLKFENEISAKNYYKVIENTLILSRFYTSTSCGQETFI